MIYKLLEKDKNAALDFLSEEPSLNLFLIGDIENNGFDKSFQEVWGSYNLDGYLDAIMLRYRENFIVYFKDENYDVSKFKEIILGYEGKKIISGKISIAKKFKDFIPEHKLKKYCFCEIKSADNLNITKEYNIKAAQPEDAKKICSLLNEIEEFTVASSEEIIAQSIGNKSKRIYYIENENGEVITTAQTTAENSKSAMIVGVATKKGYRNKGLMSACLSKLCSDVLSEGKILCLFYDNPKAGSVYMRLGFSQIDDWVMYR